MQDSEIVVKPRDVMPAGATTLPAPYYTGADYFDREMDAFFRGMWICAGRAEQVAAPGAFFLRDVVGDTRRSDELRAAAIAGLGGEMATGADARLLRDTYRTLSAEKVKDAVRNAGYPGTKLLAGPTEQ